MITIKCLGCVHHYVDNLLRTDYDTCEEYRLITPYDESLQECKDFKGKTGNFEPSDALIEKVLCEIDGMLPDCELWDTPEKMRAVIKDRLSAYDKESDYIRDLKHEMGWIE